jgi:hypothetical protein
MKVNSATGIAIGEGVAAPLQFSTGQITSTELDERAPGLGACRILASYAAHR